MRSPAPACWCRKCDRAAKVGLSPLAALRVGAGFIVCPECGNKRCPRGSNHELACTNSNLDGQPGSDWENVNPVADSSVEDPQLPGWCNARRDEIQAYVDGAGSRDALQTRQYLRELLAALDWAESSAQNAFECLKTASYSSLAEQKKTGEAQALAEANQAREARNEKSLLALQAWMKAANKDLVPVDHELTRVADRLLKQCRRPDLAEAVMNELFGHMSVRSKFVIVQARLADAEEQLSTLLAQRAEEEGDGGLNALRSLSDYFHENGNRSAYDKINQAAHHAGFCLVNGGTAIISHESGLCPLCHE